MATATIEEQLAKATEAEHALIGEIEAMEAQQRGHALDAMSDAKVRERMLRLDDDIASKKRGLALVRVAHEEGAARLAARADAEVQQQRAEREAEHARLAEARDAIFAEFETMIERMAALVGTAKTLDADLKNRERGLDLPPGRRAVDALSRYAAHHLTLAGLRFDFPFHEQGGRPISERRQAEERAADAARRAAEEAARQEAEARYEAEQPAALAAQGEAEGAEQL